MKHIVHGIGDKSVSNWYYVSKFYVEKGYLCLKVLPLACKYVFYRPKHNAKGGTHRETPVTVSAKYLSASERSYLAYLENATDYWVLSYHQQGFKH